MWFRRSALFMVLLPCVPVGVRAQLNNAATSSEIRAVMQRSADDWNRGDLNAFATCYKHSADILLIGSTNDRGYDSMLQIYRTYYGTREKMGLLTYSALDVQPLDAKFATATGHFHLERTPAGGGNINGFYMLVFEKTPQGWKIIRDDSTVMHGSTDASLSSAWSTLSAAQDNGAASKAITHVNYRPAGKLIYVQATVNGSQPLWFILDSGAPDSLIDSTTAPRLTIRAASNGSIHGAGKGDVAAGDAGAVRFGVGTSMTTVTHAKLVDLSTVSLPMKCEGLLGAEFFAKYVVRIDPLRHAIALFDPDTYTYAGTGNAVPLELTNSRLYVTLGLAVRPGEVTQRRLRVDTGSEDAIDDDTVRSSPTLQKTTLGNGLGKSYEDVSGIYDTVVFGPYTFHHVWGPAGAVPIIGMEMLRRFTMTFDAPHGKLYLEPNAALSEPVPPPS